MKISPSLCALALLSPVFLTGTADLWIDEFP